MKSERLARVVPAPSEDWRHGGRERLRELDAQPEIGRIVPRGLIAVRPRRSNAKIERQMLFSEPPLTLNQVFENGLVEADAGVHLDVIDIHFGRLVAQAIAMLL